MKTMLVALRFAALTLVLTGFAYPLLVTGFAQVFFPSAANGSLVKNEKGQVVGSGLIGQRFTGAAYFWPRPSAAGEGYDGAASSGSNLGPTSQKLRERAQQEIYRLAAAHPGEGPVPTDLAAASASGLDPHITVEAALWQAARVAANRRADPDRVRSLVLDNVEGRTFGFLGEPRVNVLQLNMACDRFLGPPRHG